jgi:hypothetical protein
LCVRQGHPFRIVSPFSKPCIVPQSRHREHQDRPVQCEMGGLPLWCSLPGSGGSATGLSATDARAEPLPVMIVNLPRFDLFPVERVRGSIPPAPLPQHYLHALNHDFIDLPPLPKGRLPKRWPRKRLAAPATASARTKPTGRSGAPGIVRTSLYLPRPFARRCRTPISIFSIVRWGDIENELGRDRRGAPAST